MAKRSGARGHGIGKATRTKRDKPVTRKESGGGASSRHVRKITRSKERHNYTEW